MDEVTGAAGTGVTLRMGAWGAGSGMAGAGVGGAGGGVARTLLVGCGFAGGGTTACGPPGEE